MNIKTTIYENLTPQQRIAAAVQALSRGDFTEHDKLTDTCPQKIYRQADYRYTGMLQGLVSVAMAVELHLTSDLLSMVCFAFVGGQDEQTEECLRRASSTLAAWRETLEDLGVDPESMMRLTAPLRHPFVSSLLEQELQEPDEEAVHKRKAEWSGLFEKIRSV